MNYRLYKTGMFETLKGESEKLPTYKDAYNQTWYKLKDGRFARLDSDNNVVYFPIEYVEVAKQKGAAVGTIKCRYAELYSQYGSPLFTLEKCHFQHAAVVFSENVQYPVNAIRFIEVTLEQTVLEAISRMCKPQNQKAVETILNSEGKVFVKPIAFNWLPASANDIDTPETKTNNKSKLALLIAGAAALLND